MSALEHILLGLYRLIPEWLLALALAAAGVSFVLSSWWQRQRGVVYALWPFGSGVGASLFLLAGCYAWLAAMPDTSPDLWRGAVRLIFLIMTATILLYNGGVIHVSWLYFRRKFR